MASNSQVELNTIKKLMVSKDPELLVALSTEHFGNKDVRNLFMIIRKFYTENSEFMGWATLRQYVSTACKTADKAKFMMSLLEQVEKRDIAGLTNELLLEELSNYQKFRIVLNKTSDLVSAVENKDIDTTLATLQDLYTSVHIQGCTSLDDYDMTRIAKGGAKFEFRKTGFKDIDARGGLIKGGYTIIAADAKQGKSTLCGNIAKHQYLHEEGSVCVLSYEMSAQEYYSRIISAHCSVDLGRVMSGTLTTEELQEVRVKESQFYVGDSEEVAEFARANASMPQDQYMDALMSTYPSRSNKFFIIDERLDWSNLFAKMQLLAETKGVVTFVIDYINLVPMGADTRNLSQWEAILHQSRKLKNFSHKYGLNVITPAQLSVGKKGEDNKIRFASNIIADCDLCIAMFMDDQDKTLDTVTCEFKAIRNGLSVPGVKFNASFKLAKEFHMSRFVDAMDF